jgi:tetratricopeptide (TPR) repeat protein
LCSGGSRHSLRPARPSRRRWALWTQYGSMLVVLGDLYVGQEHYKEALAIYDKAKAVLVHYKERREYGTLLSNMGGCHVRLSQWNEAVACYKEAVENCRTLYGPDLPIYATVLSELAGLFCLLKQFEEAIPRLEEALSIVQRVYGDQHQSTVMTAKCLAVARQDAKKSHRDKIDVGHEFRMCSQCGNIQENMNVCPCFRAWYCGPDCQLQHWATHKPHCNVCLHCNTLLTKSMHCSHCNKAKYCNAACQKAHWSQQAGVRGANGQVNAVRCRGLRGWTCVALWTRRLCRSCRSSRQATTEAQSRCWRRFCVFGQRRSCRHSRSVTLWDG